MKIIIQGLRINTCCRYIKFTRSRYINIYEDGLTSTFVIEFPHGLKSEFLIDDHIEILTPTVLQETDYIRIYNPKVDLNGLIFTKLTNKPYTFRQFIVNNIDEFIMRFDDISCDILIPKILTYRIGKYIELLKNNPYIDIIDYSRLKDLANYSSILINNKDIKIDSKDVFEYSSKEKYTKYLLNFIDIQESFITKLSSRLKDYGLELVRLPIDQEPHSVHRVTYRFTELGNQMNHLTDSNPLRFASEHRAHIDFKISTPDLILYEDFINKYQNLDIISNFTQFYTTDKLGREWLSSAFWNPIDTAFNQDYAQDELSNIAFEAGFSVDLQYYIVQDQQYYQSQSIILDLLEKSTSLNSSIIKH